MTKIMVYNFKTERFEQAEPEEGKALIDLIVSMNASCVETCHCKLSGFDANNPDICPTCKKPHPTT